MWRVCLTGDSAGAEDRVMWRVCLTGDSAGVEDSHVASLSNW